MPAHPARPVTSISRLSGQPWNNDIEIDSELKFTNPALIAAFRAHLGITSPRALQIIVDVALWDGSAFVLNLGGGTSLDITAFTALGIPFAFFGYAALPTPIIDGGSQYHLGEGPFLYFFDANGTSGGANLAVAV